MNTIKSRALGAAVLSALFAANAFPQATDPAAPTLPLRYESAFSDYRPQQDTPPLPWKNLFTAEGEFADTALQATSKEAEVRKVNPEMKVEKLPAQPAQASPPTSASDTRGRIESVNATDGKVKLKHGPIPKFDMPGMTMVFRVQDPKMVAQVKEGDEVGVTLEKIGGSLVITGFQKGGDAAANTKIDTAPPASVEKPNSALATISDTRGRIESINASDGKVKLKHGPIPKFDMPGMTMVFRVQDPKLLTQIKVGDEVGVTVDKTGSGFVITGFQK